MSRVEVALVAGIGAFALLFVMAILPAFRHNDLERQSGEGVVVVSGNPAAPIGLGALVADNSNTANASVTEGTGGTLPFAYEPPQPPTLQAMPDAAFGDQLIGSWVSSSGRTLRIAAVGAAGNYLISLSNPDGDEPITSFGIAQRNGISVTTERGLNSLELADQPDASSHHCVKYGDLGTFCR